MMVNIFHEYCSLQVPGAVPRLRLTVAHVPEWGGRRRRRSDALCPVVEAALESEDAVQAEEERQLQRRK